VILKTPDIRLAESFPAMMRKNTKKLQKRKGNGALSSKTETRGELLANRKKNL